MKYKAGFAGCIPYIVQDPKGGNLYYGAPAPDSVCCIGVFTRHNVIGEEKIGITHSSQVDLGS